MDGPRKAITARIKKKRRKAKHNINKSHYKRINPSSKKSRHKPNQGANKHCYPYCHEPNQKRDSRPVDNATENISSQIIGSKKMLHCWGGQHIPGINLKRIIWRDNRRQ